MEKYVEPIRIVTIRLCESAEVLLKGNPCQTGNAIAGEMTVIRKGGYVLLDFGKEIHGCVQIAIQRIDGIQPARLRIVYGESVMEALSSIGEKNATNSHAPRDFIAEVMPMSSVPYGETGFRFVKLEAVDADISILAVKAVLRIRDLDYLGSFECSDESLNEIWRMAAYTVQLNMHEFVWDGIKRDRLVWIGDMHPEASVIRYIFGEDESVTNSLDFIRIMTPENAWMNNIPTYSMWWIIIQHDWYMHWGRMEYLKEQKTYMQMLVDKAASWIDSGCDDTDFNLFVDWPSRNAEYEKDGVKSIFCMGLSCAAALFKAMDETEYERKCQQYAEKLRKEESKVKLSKCISALTLLSGRDAGAAVERVSDDSAENMTCFMGYYLLLAKAKLGQLKGALEVIKSYWGAMIKMGATTFWEDFDISWTENAARIDEIVPEGKRDIHGDFGRFCYKQFRHSLCHGWAGGPAPFLMEKVGGIEIVEAGCRTIRIAPDLAGLEWAKISFPTPYGVVKLDIRNQVEAPSGITIIQD